MQVDDTVDARHEVLALAILCAFVEGLRRNVSESRTASTRVPSVRPEAGTPACCDNFA